MSLRDMAKSAKADSDAYDRELKARTKHGVFPWDEGNRYPEQAAVKTFAREGDADRYAKKLNEDEGARQRAPRGYVVRPIVGKKQESNRLISTFLEALMPAQPDPAATPEPTKAPPPPDDPALEQFIQGGKPTLAGKHLVQMVDRWVSQAAVPAEGKANGIAQTGLTPAQYDRVEKAVTATGGPA